MIVTKGNTGFMRYRLYNEDCIEVMKDYSDNFFDIAIVDPPYRPVNKVSSSIAKKDKTKSFKKWHYPNKEYFDELFRVSRDQVIFGGNYFTNYLHPNNNWFIWYKNNDGLNLSMCEMAWCSIRKNIKLFNYRPMGNLKGFHPTEKPVRLYDYIYKTYCNKGIKVLDTHLGSASNAVSAHYHGVDLFVGCEIDKIFYENSIKRINEDTNQLTIF